ncbi:TonB-dependent siderophore receptor [Rhizobium sp. Leaf311]|uniref:TonB-dependent siderophore receptor n=1 Tax=Rhizobium sp. Leaf311 TaxID=1736332 RepID=UPI001FCDE3C3|nr:TonB-dependent siderophore receptor [Rhizobium sp. Leaf311]
MVLTVSHFEVARAQEQQSTTLETIVVQGAGKGDPRGPVDGYVAQTSATASKTGTPILETQQSISVVTRDQIEAQAAQTLGEALNYSAGVVGQPFGSDPRFDSPIVRGFDGRQLQYLNSLKLMSTAGAPTVEIYGLERVDVLRGPASVMYGQGNPGGIINQVSKRPQFENFGEVGTQIGSYDNYGGFFDLGGVIPDHDEFAYRLTGLAKTSGAQTDYLDNDRYFIAPALTWKPDDDTSLTILTSIQHDNPSTPSGLPPQYVLGNSNFKLPRDFFVGDKNFDDSSRTLTNFGYEFEHRFNEVWAFRQNFRYTDFDWEYQALGMGSAGLGADGRTLARTATFQDENLKTFNIDNNLTAEFSTAAVDHKVLFGFDYRYFDNDVRTRFFRATPLDVLDPIYGGPIGLLAPTLNTTVKSDLSQIGVYVQDELAYDNWRATLGLRQDWALTRGSTTNGLTGVSRSLDQDDQKLTGRAGLSYLFDGGIAPYVSYATSFDPIASSAGADFKPSEGEQWEAGIKYQPENWNGFLSAAVYDLKQTNVLRTINGVTEQIGEVQVRGVELEGVVSLIEGLDLRAAYTYTDAKIGAGADDGNRVENVPRNATSLWINYRFHEDTILNGVGIGGGVRYVGQRFGNSANTFDLDGVTLFDVALTYQRDNFKGSLNFQNIGDEKYVASCSTFGCYYGDGRTVIGKLSYTW